MSFTFDIMDTFELFLFIYSIYRTVVVCALQLIYIFLLFHPHMHEYVSFVFFLFFSLAFRVVESHRVRADSYAFTNKFWIC